MFELEAPIGRKVDENEFTGRQSPSAVARIDRLKPLSDKGLTKSILFLLAKLLKRLD